MAKKSFSPVYWVLLYSTFPNYIILQKLFEDKESALAYGQDLWSHIYHLALKNTMVIVSVVENQKDFDHSYGAFVKTFYVPRDEDVKCFEIEYLYNLKKLNGFIHAYCEEDAREIYARRTGLFPDSITSVREIK